MSIDLKELSAEGFLTVRQAREFLSVSNTTFYQLMNDQEIPYVTFGRNRRIPRVGLQRFLDRSFRGGVGGVSVRRENT